MRKLILLGAALAAALGLALSAQAAEEKRFGQEILEILLQEEKIDQGTYERLKAKEEAEYQELQATRAAMAEAGKTPPVSSEGPTWKIKYSNGLQFKRSDGMANVKIGGRMQADFATVQVDQDLRDALGLAGEDDPEGTGAEFRRARIYISGDLYDRVIFKAQYDFADGITDFKDVWVGLKKLGPVGTFKIGHFKEPYSLEQMTSSKYLTFLERSLVTSLDEGRNMGVQLNNQHMDKRLTWALGAFLETDDQAFRFDNLQDWAVTGRLTGLPYYEDEGAKLLHLGFSGSARFRHKTDTRFRQRPEIHLTERLVDTGTFQSDQEHRIAAEAALVYGPFSLQTEYKASFVKETSSGTGRLDGVYVEASWFPTGEHRNYKKSSAAFGRVSPNHSFNPSEGHWGAFELAARYSYLDLNDDSIAGGRQQNFTAGINWYLFSNLMMRANYVYGDVKDSGVRLGNASGDLHAFTFRTQLEF